MTGAAARVYLDWNATAPLRPEARAAMLEAMDAVGNPSSVHAEGRAARALVERARARVAALADCAPEEVVFTSGATEAAALALAGRETVIASATDHDCVLAHALDTVRHPSDRDGVVRIGEGVDAEGVCLLGEGDAVTTPVANSETGVLSPAGENAARLRADLPRGAVIFADAVQAVGRTGWSFADTGADLACLSAHKLGGPTGTGALVVRQGVDLDTPLKGGGQETGRRSGTENVIGIAGFGAAAEAARREREAGVWERVEFLRIILENTLEGAVPDLILVGRDAPRLPNTSCFAVPGWKGETQVMQMDLAGFAVSAGSACSSGKVRESRVLRAMGLEAESADSAIRVSLGPATTESEVRAFAEAWIAQYTRRRARAA